MGTSTQQMFKGLTTNFNAFASALQGLLMHALQHLWRDTFTCGDNVRSQISLTLLRRPVHQILDVTP